MYIIHKIILKNTIIFNACIIRIKKRYTTYMTQYVILFLFSENAKNIALFRIA